jgi:hypothetical protein
LNHREQRIAARMFGESLDVSKVQLAFGCRLMNWPKRSMNRTPGNTIFLSKKYSDIRTNAVQYRYEDMLVHELTHAWQTQHGISLFKKYGPLSAWFFTKESPTIITATQGCGKKDCKGGISGNSAPSSRAPSWKSIIVVNTTTLMKPTTARNWSILPARCCSITGITSSRIRSDSAGPEGKADHTHVY